MLSLGTLAGTAFRNLERHKGKTVITTLAVALSVAVFIAADSWLVGVDLESERNIINYETGAAKIETRLYFDKKDELPMYENFDGWERYASAAAEAGYDTAPRFTFSGTLYSEAAAAPMVFYGVDPARESQVLGYPDFIEGGGRYIRGGAFEIVLGSMAADKLKVGIPRRISRLNLDGDLLPRAASEADFLESLYVALPAAPGTPQGDVIWVLKNGVSRDDLGRLWTMLDASGRMDARLATTIDMKDGAGKVRHVNQIIDVKIVGIVNAPDPALNGCAWLPLDILQDENGLMLDGHITELLVRKAGALSSDRPGKSETPEAIRAALEGRGAKLSADLEVYRWLDFAADYAANSRSDKMTTNIIALLLFVLSLIGISNTALMSILERTKEMGMLRALGLSGGELIALYMLEAGFTGLIGALAGIVLGCLINIPMVYHGIDFSSMLEATGDMAGYRIAAISKSAWHPPVIVASAIVAPALAALTAFLPARRALKMPVTDCIRFE